MLGKTKGTLEQLEPVVGWDPPPCYVSHFSKLREGYAAAKVVHPLCHAPLHLCTSTLQVSAGASVVQSEVAASPTIEQSWSATCLTPISEAFIHLEILADSPGCSDTGVAAGGVRHDCQDGGCCGAEGAGEPGVPGIQASRQPA